MVQGPGWFVLETILSKCYVDLELPRLIRLSLSSLQNTKWQNKAQKTPQQFWYAKLGNDNSFCELLPTCLLLRLSTTSISIEAAAFLSGNLVTCPP